MKTEARFLVAIVLMVGVLIGTNLLFPPVPPDDPVEVGETDTGAPVDESGDASGAVAGTATRTDEPPTGTQTPAVEPTGEAAPAAAPATPAVPERRITVRGPLQDFEFSNYGALLHSAILPLFASFVEEGPVQLLPRSGGAVLGNRIVVAADTLDFTRVPFDVTPSDGLTLVEGGGPETLRFSYEDSVRLRGFEVEYSFDPDSYVVGVRGRATGIDRGLLLTELGTGIAYNEAQEKEEERARAYVVNHLQSGIRQQPFTRFREDRIEDGPFFWTAFKSKYFVMALLAGESEDDERYLGGVLARRAPSLEDADAVSVAVGQGLAADGSFSFRLFLGPQDFARLSAIGNDLEDVNPIGWRWLRPVIRPFAAIITTVLTYLHNQLGWGYGWVLILFGVMMRVLLFPLNQKAMRAQIKNMAVQPLLKEIQTKYKDQPERMQKELMKLYKEHGFNPLAGCLPMLLPWPVLITLFFVFQNTIELRGVPFLWLPDLAAPDPFFILPVFLGVSMFLLQWVSMRSIEQPNPQLKMMMWFMPIFMVVIFFQLASGLNLYYATANIATLPQQYWIAKERKKAQAKAPVPSPAG